MSKHQQHNTKGVVEDGKLTVKDTTGVAFDLKPEEKEEEWDKNDRVTSQEPDETQKQVSFCPVLSMNEPKQLKVLETNNVAYLKLLTEVDTTEIKVTELKKRYDKNFPSSEFLPSVEDVVEEMSEDEWNK